MMRKFPQILAVVLAIAILICPAINLTPIANTSANNYNISYDEDDSVVTVNVSAADGFIAALVRLSVVGYTINEDTNISVSSAVPTDPSVTDLSVAVHDSDIVDGVLSILITDADNAKARLISSATISIPVIRDETVTEEVGITLSYIQAADGGEYDVNNDVLRSEELIVFPHVDNAENGAINLEAAAAAGMTLTVADVPPHVCTAVTYSDNGDGTHDGICDCDAETVVVDNEAHADENADNKCDKCPASLEAECQHANKTFVEVAKVATAEENGALKFHCADCNEDVLCTVEFKSDLITFVTPAISCEATTILRLKTAKTTSLSAYSNGVLVVKHNYQNNAAATTNSYNMSDLDLVSSRYQLDIPVIYTQFTDTFDCALYLEKDGVWYFNGGTPYSLRDVAMTYINGTTEEKFKYASANLLKVGAAAQNEFDYAKTNLADSELDGSQYVVDTTPAISSTEGVNFTGLPADYATAGKVFYITPGVLLSDSTAMTVKANKAYYTGAELNDLRLEYTYTRENGATKTGEITEFELDSKGRMLFTLDLDAPDMRSVVTFKLYNGDTQVADDAVFSVEGAMGSYYKNGQYTNVIERALIYSDVVASYF